MDFRKFDPRNIYIPPKNRFLVTIAGGYGALIVITTFLSSIGIGQHKTGMEAVSSVAAGIKNNGYPSAERGGSCPDKYPLGMPDLKQQVGGKLLYLCRYGFASLYSVEYKAPLWTSEWVHLEDGTPPPEQKPKGGILPDPQLSQEMYPTRDALNGQGLVRGMMSSTFNQKYNYWGNKEVFFVSNSVPMAERLSNGAWAVIGKEIADRAFDKKKHPAGLIVYTGPVYLGKNRVRLSDGTPVPSHFFKILIDKATGASTALVLPNKELPLFDNGMNNGKKSMKLGAYTVSVRQVERWTGIDFNPILRRDVSERIEKGKSVWFPA